ncbi:MAG: hypothetical protein WCP01_06445 [Methylococcaceae bacterium]|jgi:hypothetical protein
MSGFKQMTTMAWLVAGALVRMGVCAAGNVPVVGEKGPYGGTIYYVDSSGVHG